MWGCRLPYLPGILNGPRNRLHARIPRLQSGPRDGPCGPEDRRARGVPRTASVGSLLLGRLHHRLPLPHHRVPAVPRARVRLVADRSRGLPHLRGALAGALGPVVLLRPDRRIVVPRDASAEVHARRRRAERSRNRGGPRRHLERDRDRRDARRALLRGARLAFRLTGAFFFRGAFLARAFFGGAAVFGGAFAGGARTAPSIGTSL